MKMERSIPSVNAKSTALDKALFFFSIKDIDIFLISSQKQMLRHF